MLFIVGIWTRQNTPYLISALECSGNIVENPLYFESSMSNPDQSAAQTATPKLSVFLEWCGQNGIWIDPRIELRDDESAGVGVFAVTSLDTASTGVGPRTIYSATAVSLLVYSGRHT